METDVTDLSTNVGSVGAKQTSLQTSFDSLKKTVDELSKKVNGTGSVTVSLLTSKDSSYTWYTGFANDSGFGGGAVIMRVQGQNYTEIVSSVIAAISFTVGAKSIALGIGTTSGVAANVTRQSLTTLVIGQKGFSVTAG